MAENQQNNPSDFMIEKIKQRPVNKRKLLRRTLITVCMAVIFGLVACFTFLVLEPVFNKWLYPEEEPQLIIFPEETEEMKPEDMLTSEQEKEANEIAGLEEEQIQEILSAGILDLNSYTQLYAALDGYLQELSYSMVTVTGIVSETDWFNNPYETKGQTFGVVVADNGKEVLILTNYSGVKRTSRVQVAFYDGVLADAQLKQSDSQTNLAVLAVPKESVPVETLENLKIATIGSSSLDAKPGTPVIAMGSPMGVNGSVSYGIITTEMTPQNIIDSNYKQYMTNILGSTDAKGVLFNLQGEIIGIIGIGKSSSDMKNIVSALGTSELRKVIAKMTNAEPIAYMGIYGVDVTEKAHQELGVPYGAYINQVTIDSPAMLAGIQCGDVIIHFGSETIGSYNDYVAALLRAEAGSSIQVTILRQVQEDYKEMTMNITLGTAE